MRTLLRNKLVRIGGMALLAAALLFGVMTTFVPSEQHTAHASFNNEPFEFENYYTYGGKKDGVFSLTYLDIGGGKCDKDDHRFRINVDRSYAGSEWKLYSNNSKYQGTPTGRTIYGFQLEGTSAHICIGKGEFSLGVFGWSDSGVQQNIYAWRHS